MEQATTLSSAIEYQSPMTLEARVERLEGGITLWRTIAILAIVVILAETFLVAKLATYAFGL